MGEMPMSGGWTMSNVWLRMPGETWPGAAAAFIGMWDVMMVAMMLPSLMPVLLRYRREIGRAGEKHVDRLTLRVGAGYFIVWTVLGMVVRALGLLFITLEMQLPPLARAVPLATAAIVLLAGMYQFSTWKAHYLARCRTPWPGDKVVAATAIDAWRYGLRLGMHCVGSCVGLTAILLVAGVMDLRAMVVVTGAISLERLARHGQCAARAIGTVSISAGLFLVVRAAWLG